MFFKLILAGGSFDLLSVNPGLLFWTVITFLTVLAVLWLFAWKPLLRALDARNDKIVDDLKQSAQLRKEAEDLLAKYQESLKQAKNEVVAILEEARIHADKEREGMLERAKEECKGLHERVNNDIAVAKETFIHDMKNMVTSTTISLVEKLFSQKVDMKQHKSFVENEFSKLQFNASKN